MSEKAKDFILNRLKIIVGKIPTIKINYDFDESEDEHLIEITPIEEFENNQDLISFKTNLILDYTDEFYGTIILVSSDHLLRSKKSSLEIRGTKCDNKYLVINDSNQYSEDKQIWELLLDTKSYKIVRNQSSDDSIFNTVRVNLADVFNYSGSINNKVIIQKEGTDSKCSCDFMDETFNYALAA